MAKKVAAVPPHVRKLDAAIRQLQELRVQFMRDASKATSRKTPGRKKRGASVRYL